MFGIPKIPDDEFKEFVYEHISRVGKAFSSPQRLVIMNILSQGEHSVESLAKQSNLSIPNLSRHLQLLKAANLVKIRREGKYIFYRLADEETSIFYMKFKDFAANRIAEIRAALEEISSYPSRAKTITIEELRERLNDESIIIIDVRPREEFKEGHIPGAISIPLEELEKRLNELPKDKDIVAFCRGKFCVLGDKAVNLLLEKGYRARRIEDGIIEWKLAGLPVENESDE